MHTTFRFPAYANYLRSGGVHPSVGIRPMWSWTFRAAHELMCRIASRILHPCAKGNLCAATDTCLNLPESSAPIHVTADCAVLHRESSKRPAPPRNTKDREHLQPTTANRHNSQTTHQAPSKGQSHNTNQHSSRAGLQHSNPLPSLHKPIRVIVRSSQPTQPNAKQRGAEPNYHTDTTHTSGDTRRPLPWGPMIWRN